VEKAISRLSNSYDIRNDFKRDNGYVIISGFICAKDSKIAVCIHRGAGFLRCYAYELPFIPDGKMLGDRLE
jgi:hypothetical protein